MPELPEVETIRRGLGGWILGQKMTRVEVLCEKSWMGEFVSGVVKDLRRRGKALIIDLENGRSLMIHLRMTGQLIYDGGAKKRGEAGDGAAERPGDGAGRPGDRGERYAGGHPSENFVEALPNKQTRVVMHFENGGVLYFNDQRKFGFVKMLPTPEVEEDAFIKKLAKEPWQMDAKELMMNLARHKKAAMKGVILDQTVVCGLGNIYADEALFAAGIHPERKAGSVSGAEAERLLKAMRAVMEKSLEAGGSTIRNYVKADGSRGNYLDLFVKVYGREGKPCERCGGPIAKIKVAGRGTHFCPKCQRLK